MVTSPAPEGGSVTSPETSVIDKRGNVLLELGENDNSVRLLVSSNTLSLASTVFDAMFNRGFSEGQNLSFMSPKIVPFLDDNPTQMILLCKVIHVQNSSIPVKLELDALSDFASICDKYDASDAVRAWSILWVNKLLPEIASPGFEKMLYITYALDLAEEFYQATSSILKDRVTKIDYEIATNGRGLPPSKLIYDLQNQHEEAQRQVMATIQTGYILKKRNCCTDSIMTNDQFIPNLLAVKLWPIKQDRSLSEYIDGVSDLSSIVGDGCGMSYCPISSGSFPHMVKKVKEIVDSAEGRCLDCVKRGSDANDGRNCRIPHTPYDGFKISHK